MTQPDFATIKPLIAHVDTQGRTVHVWFRCPVSGDEVTARHTLPEGRGIGNQLSTNLTRSLLQNLQYTLASLLRSVLGGGAVGRAASSAAQTALSTAARSASEPRLSPAEQQQAVLEAFGSVSARFVFDPERRRWIAARAAAELMSGFQKQSVEHPIEHGYDRQVLARMLVEIARSDGRLSSEESTWLTDLIAADMGSLDALTRRPPLTRAELGQTTKGTVRSTLLMTAWALALCDEHLESSESALLESFAAGLGLAPAAAEAARLAAQLHLMDQALERMWTWGGHDQHARESLFALAERLGLDRAAAEEAEARYQRRNVGR